MSLPLITGISGINQGMDNFKQHAYEIASSATKGGEDTADLAKSMMDLNTDQRQIEASVKVVQAIDEALGTILDTNA